MTDNEMLILKEAIRKKYETHRLAKPGKYPVLKFNSYPAPYEHLRTSFKEELASHGQADMQEALATIPSAKVFAKVFHEGYIIKDENVLNTCYLYAWRKPKTIDHEEAPASVVPNVPKPTTTPAKAIFTNRANRHNLLWGASVIVIGLLAYVAIGYYPSTFSSNRLVITNPINGMTVPHIIAAEGKAPKGQVVWLVIHPIEWPDHQPHSSIPEYYAQDPIQVGDDGTWKGVIYVGGVNKAHIGIRSQLRAFINPTKLVLEEQPIYAWPQAELSSEIIEIVRGSQDMMPPTP